MSKSSNNSNKVFVLSQWGYDDWEVKAVLTNPDDAAEYLKIGYQLTEIELDALEKIEVKTYYCCDVNMANGENSYCLPYDKIYEGKDSNVILANTHHVYSGSFINEDHALELALQFRKENYPDYSERHFGKRQEL